MVRAWRLEAEIHKEENSRGPQRIRKEWSGGKYQDGRE